MFGSYKVNSVPQKREISFEQALPGFLIVVSNPDGKFIKPGDLICKTNNDWHFRVHPEPRIFNIVKDKAPMIVKYVDMELNFKTAEE